MGAKESHSLRDSLVALREADVGLRHQEDVDVALTYSSNESYVQIFPTLIRLVEEGLAKKRVAPWSGGRIQRESFCQEEENP